MMEMLITLVSVALWSSGLSAIIVAILNHHWAKKRGTSTKLDALCEAQKVLMIDRVRWLGESYIIRGYITLDETVSVHQGGVRAWRQWTFWWRGTSSAWRN